MHAQVHAEGKAFDRSNDDALLKRVAEVTIGYSGADLANLCNEAAIYMVILFTATLLCLLMYGVRGSVTEMLLSFHRCCVFQWLILKALS